MDLNLILELLNLYSWAVASIIMIFIAAIAKLYQEKFGIKSYYYIYFIPSIVFFIVLLRIFPFFDLEAEFIELSGSVISFISVYFLYRKMVGVK